MERRRAIPSRPASSEEVERWSHARSAVTSLNDMYANPSEAIGRVNRLIASWPSDDTLPAEGFEGVKIVHKKLVSGLQELKNNAEKETKAIDNAIEHLEVLTALRKASEAQPLEKRNKRPRGQSPAASSAPGTPSIAGASRGVSITLPARNSVGPTASIPFSREPKARREALAKQLPLQEGRKVAFHPPPSAGSNGETDENTWILAVVTKCINQDKNRYEVQDAENQDDGQPGQCYNTTLRAIIPLPDPNAPPQSAAHLNAYPQFSSGSVVMALYPDTSCFYRAEVVSSPNEIHPAGRASPMWKPMYKLKFEDDDDQEHSVAAQWVVEWPG